MEVIPGALFLACSRPKYVRRVVQWLEENSFPFLDSAVHWLLVSVGKAPGMESGSACPRGSSAYFSVWLSGHFEMTQCSHYIQRIAYRILLPMHFSGFQKTSLEAGNKQKNEVPKMET